MRLFRRRPTPLDEDALRSIVAGSSSRLALWPSLIAAGGVRSMAEIGVYRGNFAARVLAECDAIATYYMVDPWRRLEDWNKPANRSDDRFAQFYEEAMDRTRAWAGKRVVLRGRTSEVIDEVPDGALDLAYIDGDHTLRGITIDLTRVFPKVRDGGWIGGDDFARSIWQHDARYEPTLVFPYAVYFAEAVDAPIYALPHNQFLIEKRPGHRFVDLAGGYEGVELRRQVAPRGADPDRE
jgi:Methyltransferase domain